MKILKIHLFKFITCYITIISININVRQEFKIERFLVDNDILIELGSKKLQEFIDIGLIPNSING